MNETIKAILERRSIRKFKLDAVDKSLIDQIIQAGIYAPSGHGEQSSIVIAVTDKDFRNTLADENRKIAGWKEGMDPFYGAPVILIVLANKKAPTPIYDGSSTITNMLLAAHSLGLGTCWIHRAKQEFESDFGKDVLTRLGILGDYEGIGHIALGYIDGEEPKAAPRKAGRVFYIE